MAENRFSYAPTGNGNCRDTVCIETNRVLDSCRDRDCFEDVRVYLSDFGNEILERTGAIRAKCAKIVWSCIGIDPIQFNRGFYAVTIRFYVKITFEVCVGGGHSQEIEGIAVLEKRVILYGGESNVNIFKSNGLSGGFCCHPEPVSGERNVPTAIVEVVDPVVLGTKILEKATECNCCCCCCENDLPETVLSSLEAPLVFDDDDRGNRRILTVSLGIFSVVRIVRPAQYLIQATEYCIPEKECHPVEEDDPCKVFRCMPFPVGEFCGSNTAPPLPEKGGSGRCGCGS
ncbi:MAG: hypothetical protein IJX62_09115 [Clostridia bacterium]|nr:hypothetical protein [Clostridia bacterium]